jgi:hypothetical protein
MLNCQDNLLICHRWWHEPRIVLQLIYVLLCVRYTWYSSTRIYLTRVSCSHCFVSLPCPAPATPPATPLVAPRPSDADADAIAPDTAAALAASDNSSSGQPPGGMTSATVVEDNKRWDSILSTLRRTKVMALRDELRKRRLPPNGLKDAVVGRLFEAMKAEETGVYGVHPRPNACDCLNTTVLTLIWLYNMPCQLQINGSYDCMAVHNDALSGDELRFLQESPPHTHARAHTHTHTRARAHTHTHARAHTHTHTHSLLTHITKQRRPTAPRWTSSPMLHRLRALPCRLR